MADTTFDVLDAAAATVTFRAQSVNATTLVMMSVPSDPTGTTLVGQKVMASSLPVAIASNQTNLPINVASFGGTGAVADPVFGLGIFPPITTKVVANFTRPADATTYSPGDAIANTTTAGGVTAMTWAIATAGNIRRLMQTKSNTTNVQTINLWLFDANPGTAAVDNAAFSTQIINSLGTIQIGVTATGSDVAAGWSNCDIPVRAGTVYGLLQANGTLTTVASESYTTVLWYLPG